MKTIQIVFVAMSILLASCSNSTDENTVASPDKSVELKFYMDEGVPVYSVSYNNQLVIDKSALGFSFVEQDDLKAGLKIERATVEAIDEEWETVWGEQRIVENKYNQLRVDLAEEQGAQRKFTLVFKVYNDGLGFRYEFPEQENMTAVVISDEHTQFNLTGDHDAWWIPGDWEIYEHLYTHSRLSEVDAGAKRENKYLAQTYIPDPNAVNTPLTMKTDAGLYISIHEANLTDYAGMTLHIDKETMTLNSALVAWEDGAKVKTQTPFVTPWRTIQIAEKAGDLIESNLIVNLNEPNKLENTEWVKPTKYVGIWWAMHLGLSSWDVASGKHGATTENAKYYIDFAAKNGFDAVLIEGWNTGWEEWVGEDREGIFDWLTPYADFDIEAVVAYGKENGVEIVGHHETSGDVGTYDRTLEKTMAFYNNHGVGAVKTGYVGTVIPAKNYHHGQWMVNHYRKVLEIAAKNKVMVVAHEPIKATGIRRTYPNCMAREGLRGQEFNAWSDGNPPSHTAIVPFTRMLGGPIDFTPGIFNTKLKVLPNGASLLDVADNYSELEAYKGENQVNTTLAKQLALYVVLYSPVQMAADLPQHYQGHPAFEFIKDVPVDWETSKVLDSEIGEFVVMARQERGGDSWFVGGLTNEDARNYSVDFKFLEAGKKYKVTAYLDGANAHWDNNPLSYKIETIEDVDSTSVIDFAMAPGGGFALTVEVVE